MIAAGDAEHFYGIPYTYAYTDTSRVCGSAGVQERGLRTEAMAEKDSSDTQEQEFYYCTSSSDDSDVIDALDLHEMVLDEEGEAETILVSARKSPRACDATSHQPTEKVLGGQGYAEFFRKCVSSLNKEKIIQCSPRGQKVRGLLDHLESGMPEDNVAEIASMLLPRLNTCIVNGEKYQLPSAAQAAIWSAFHQLRQDDRVMKSWNAFITRKVPQSHQSESLLALQLLLDRMLKMFFQNIAQGHRHTSTSKSSASGSGRPLTAIETNAVRYMAGYVAVNLLKRYNKPTKHAQLKIKRNYFVRVLKGMKATEQPEMIDDSVVDYSRVWSDLIDRGGLYHISDDVFHLIESIEMVVRQHLNIPAIQSYQPNTDLREGILKEALGTPVLLSYWETIAHCIPSKYEKYSIELLKAIIELWITIRGHSFAKDWTSRFESKRKKGTRKALREIQDTCK